MADSTPCPVCGLPVYPWNLTADKAGTAYCGRHCRGVARRASVPPVKRRIEAKAAACAFCGAIFVPRHQKQRVCSAECRQAVLRKAQQGRRTRTKPKPHHRVSPILRTEPPPPVHVREPVWDWECKVRCAAEVAQLGRELRALAFRIPADATWESWLGLQPAG